MARRSTSTDRRSLRRRQATAVLAAALAVVAGAFSAAPASAEVVRSGCADLGSFSAASHPGACWRPFSPTSPFNQRLLPDDPRVVPNSAQIVSRLNSFGKPGTMEFGPGEANQGRGAKPIYYNKPTDPLYTLRFTEDPRNGGSWGPLALNGMQVRIPDGATPGQATDRHMIIVDQASGYSYDLWQVRGGAVRGGGTLTATWGGRVSLSGDGRYDADWGTGGAAGMGIAGGIVRPEELLEGDIPHALYLAVQCTNGTSVYPSTRDADNGEKDCASSGGGSNADAPALGQRLQLDYTDEQIADLDAPAHEKVLLRAMAHYGLILIDTTPDPWHIEQESSVDRTSMGVADPGVEFAKQAGLPYWPEGKRYVWSLDKIPGVDGRPGSWTKDLQVIKPCVSEGTCPMSAPAPGSAPLWPTGSSPSGSAAPVVTAVSRATASATVTVKDPALATATARATVSVKASAPVTAPKKAGGHAKARKAAKAKALRSARIQARRKARRAAHGKALKLAMARAHIIARKAR
jgi:hypothetical protein